MIPIKDIDLEELIIKMIDLRASGKLTGMEEMETWKNAILVVTNYHNQQKPAGERLEGRKPHDDYH